MNDPSFSDLKFTWSYVQLYNDLGFSIIPLVYGQKSPALVSWKEFQTRKLTLEELQRWFFNDSREWNVGVICGQVSGNLAVIDFDNVEVYQRFFPKWRELEKETLVVKTSRGRHVYFQTDKPVESCKFTSLGFDLQAEGKYVVAPPSLHPNGCRYEFVSNAQKVLFIPDFERSFWNVLSLRFGITVPSKTAPPENIHYNVKWRKLRSSTEKRLVKFLAKYWRRGYRNQLCMSFCGYALKKGIPYEQAYRIIDAVTDLANDEEKKERLKLIDYHYKTRFGMIASLKGISGIREIIREVFQNE